jgi:hypothetical protein
MIISQSQIQFATRHSYQEKLEVRERLIQRNEGLPNNERAEQASENADRRRIAPQRLPAAASTSAGLPAPATQPQTLNLRAAVSSSDRLQLLIIAQLYKQITGKEMQLMTPDQMESPPATINLEVSTIAPGGAEPVLVYERQTRYEETEKMHFAAQGRVVTQDGKEIAFSAELYMNRSFATSSSLRIVGGNAVMTDPLVINFDGTGAQLESTHFAFDLDSDGTPEQIANLRPNSGYLALDRNGDGVINNGKELFGPVSNNGFSELATYDEDGNGFIDEADSIYNQLRIWQRDSNGSSRLLALGDKQIGAIYLGHTYSPMQLKDAQNSSLGEVVSSGIYLRENGSTGLVQQINLAV